MALLSTEQYDDYMQLEDTASPKTTNCVVYSLFRSESCLYEVSSL